MALACLALAIATAIGGSPASASVGYELDASTPTRSLTGVSHGIAVNQADRSIYVAVVTTSPTTGAPGHVARFASDLSATGTFTVGSNAFYGGVAVNPVTQGFYAAQALLHTPQGDFGAAKMDAFSAAGSPTAQFALSDTGTLPQIATDSNGDVFYPDAVTDTVRVFNSTGTLQEAIACSGCPGGSFGTPVSVAIDSEDNLYVADLTPDRVVKFTLSGGTYSYASTLQSGRGAAAVGVDPSDDTVFVGDMPNGRDYHIVAYSSSGIQFDDFGAGLFTDPEPQFGAIVAQQIAADETTHKLYVGDVGKFYIFERTDIDPPTAAIATAAPVGQLTATLRATVNANGHAVVDCEFEYTDEADFQANGFANAGSVPCAQSPDGTADTAIEAKVSGLSPVTEYRFRVRAESNGGATTSGSETLETLAVVAPTATTESPTGVTETGAVMKGKVNPQGGTVSSCRFEYGTSTSYGKSLPCLPLPSPVATDVPEARSLSNLIKGTTYHYRLVITTNAGTTQGADVQFATASPPPPPPSGEPPVTAPPPPPPAVAPLPSVTPTPARPLRCKKGFRKKRVRGKVRCVKKRRAARRRPSQAGRR